MNDETQEANERADRDAMAAAQTDDGNLSHRQVLDQLCNISADVMLVLLSHSLSRRTYVAEGLRDMLRPDIIGILNNHKLSPTEIEREVDWCICMTEATRRVRMTLIALVLSIYC